MCNDFDKVLNREYYFKYPAINTKTQVRLLRVSPNCAAVREMHYSLETFDLSNLPSTHYTALSYTWGHATSTDEIDEISINGQPFFVRKNLYDFLETANGKRESGMFFVDAICINQLDSTERLCQVREMACIYRNANKVIAWLGVPETAQELASVRFLAQIKDRSGCANWTAQQWDGFRYLSYHPYWSRVWVVQEVLLARSMEIWCWYFTFSLSLFMGISPTCLSSPSKVRFSADGRPRTAFHAISHSCSPAEKIITHRTRHVLRPIADPLAQGTAVGTLEEMTKGLKCPYTASKTYQSRVPDLIHKIIQKFGMLECLDPRDKFYGFLGVLKDSSRVKVNPDYTMPVSYAFRQALEIGLEEIGGEHWVGMHSRQYIQAYDIWLAYYCDVRDAFNMNDGEGMSILREVVAEIRHKARLRDPMLEGSLARNFMSHNEDIETFPDLEKLLRISALGEGKKTESHGCWP
ncbi:HET-domain-containing protein [Jackrogersella minutella]|nr:HET-domain-containing protein [Jackrogersella minutella]